MKCAGASVERGKCMMRRRTPSKFQLYLDLVGQASASQLHWRARRIAWQKLGCRLNAAFSKPIIDDGKLIRALRADADGLSPAVGLFRGGNVDEAVCAVVSYLKSKQYQVWPLSEQRLRDTAQVVSERFPSVADRICRKAEESLAHRFEFEGSGTIDFGKRIDWNSPRLRTCEQIYALNRFYHLPNVGRAYLLTNDPRYVREIQDLVAGWLSANRFPGGRPWNVLTTALRLNNWLEAYGCVKNSHDLADAGHLNVAKAVLSHADFLAHHVEYDIGNNHMIFEGRTLLAAGIGFPEFKDASRWRVLGMAVLNNELRSQIWPDGSHVEQSTAYHLQVMWEYLCACWALESCGEKALPTWRETLSKMADFLMDIVRPDGTVPMIGDSALHDPQTPYPADVLAVASVLLDRPELRQRADKVTEEAIWLLRPRVLDALTDSDSPAKPLRSVSYPDGGYCIFRRADPQLNTYAVFDCGPFGFEKCPGHGHADALSFEFSAFGRNLIVDPGVYTYEAGVWRDFFRGTSAHNTIAVDEQDQAYLWGAFRVYRPRPAALKKWHEGSRITFADAAFRGTDSNVTHRRRIALIDGLFLVVYDYLSGKGEHDFVLYYHFSVSDTRLVRQSGSTVLCVSVQSNCDAEGAGVAVLSQKESEDAVSVLCGSEDPIQGWISYEKGRKVPAPVLKIRRRCNVPATFVTIVYPFRGVTPPETLDLSVEHDRSWGYGASVTFTAGTTRYKIVVSEDQVESSTITVANRSD